MNQVQTHPHLKVKDRVVLLTNELAGTPGEIIDTDGAGNFVVRTEPTVVTVSPQQLERE